MITDTQVFFNGSDEITKLKIEFNKLYNVLDTDLNSVKETANKAYNNSITNKTHIDYIDSCIKKITEENNFMKWYICVPFYKKIYWKFIGLKLDNIKQLKYKSKNG